MPALQIQLPVMNFLAKKEAAKVAGVVVVIVIWAALWGLVFVGVKKAKIGVDDEYVGDNLLGWTTPPEKVEKMGYELVENCIVLNSDNDCLQPLVILITGGSASDIAWKPDNWPHILHMTLNEKGVCHKIVVAAVAGYSSGQEFLKLVRDGVKFRPDVHISYSGANEHINSGYVTSMAREMWQSTGRSEISTPNAGESWFNNIAMMSSVAEQYNYRFVAVIQPARLHGSGSHAPSYNYHFPIMRKLAATSGIEFYDFSERLPLSYFKDDCHVRAEGNEIIANWMIDALNASGCTDRQF